jgi:pyruvate/2-oxoglutarate dehydrogenase complex dihydrolipoamide acyltransferase (E2) component
MAAVEIKVPDIGDFDEVTVIELLVKVGDTIKPEQSLITVESDKASMEIPAAQGGVVKELKVKLGDKVKQGTVVLVVEGEGGAAAPALRLQLQLQPPPAPAPVPRCRACGTSPHRRQLRRYRRPGMRRGCHRRWTRRLLRGFPRGRPGAEGHPGRALRHARRRLPERRLHSVEGAAARGRGDGRSQPHGVTRC